MQQLFSLWHSVSMLTSYSNGMQISLSSVFCLSRQPLYSSAFQLSFCMNCLGHCSQPVYIPIIYFQTQYVSSIEDVETSFRVGQSLTLVTKGIQCFSNIKFPACEYALGGIGIDCFWCRRDLVALPWSKYKTFCFASFLVCSIAVHTGQSALFSSS